MKNGQAPPYCGNFPHASEKYYKKIPLIEKIKEKEFYAKTYPLILTIVSIILSIIGGVFF